MALLKYFQSCNFEVVQYRKFIKDVLFQAPFDSDRKRMSTIVRLHNGKEFVFMKGASEYMIKVSSQFHDLQSNEVVKINSSLK